MIRGFQWDLARQVERLDWLLAQLPKYSDWGYNELHLHLEDAVDYPSLPGVARQDAYTWRQFERLVRTADRHGIKVVPIVNLLGHTQYLIKTPEWRDLNELRGPDGAPLPQGQICPSLPRTLEVADLLLRDVAPYCTADKVHVGLDESFHLGKHPASRREVAELGLAAHFARYVGKLRDLSAARGLRTALWADMLVLLPDAIERLPPGLIVYDWFYHGFDRRPRFEPYNFAEYDLVPALRNCGAEHWACPMNGAFRHEPLPVFGERLANAMSWWRRGLATGAEGFLVTGWEPNRLALETTQLVDAAIAGLWLDAGPHDHTGLLAAGWRRLHGRSGARPGARRLLQADAYAFCGYARWETHRCWDTVHARGEVARFAAEERFFRRLKSGNWPAALAASLDWRTYLATRDHFIRRAHLAVRHARRLRRRDPEAALAAWIAFEMAAAESFEQARLAAVVAARLMWRGTRSTRLVNPNLDILRADRERLRSWCRWLRRIHRAPALVFTASPVAGSVMVCAWVHTIEPSLQQLVIQIQNADGCWTDLHQRYLIEFRARAARPRCHIRHALSVPLPDDNAVLRFALRGPGTCELSDVHLTDGVFERPAMGPRRIRLGIASRPEEFLTMDRSANRAEWRPDWAPAG